MILILRNSIRYCSLSTESPPVKLSWIDGEIKDIYGRINYTDPKVVLAISHQKATSRYLKVPSKDTKEIEKMIALQVSKSLPFSIDEIVIGYQIVDTDEEGFSSVNLVVVNKAVVESYLSLMRQGNIDVDSVFLSTYGLQQILNLNLKETTDSILINIESPQLEIAVSIFLRVVISPRLEKRYIPGSNQELTLG